MVTTYTYADPKHLRLLEEPAGSLVSRTLVLQRRNGRVGGAVTTTSSAEGLGDSAARVGEAESADARGRVDATCASGLDDLEPLLDGCQLYLESIRAYALV